MTQINARVGAILDSNENEIKILGYGVYEGKFVPGEAVGRLADMARTYKIPTPRVRLDSGKVIYGGECWWGAEKKIKKLIKVCKENGQKIVLIDIDVYRKNWKKNHITLLNKEN